MSARAVRAELASILARADGSREDSAEFSAAEMNGWDAGLRQALTTTRLLRRGHPRQALPCPHCDEDHIVEVAWEGDRALAWCPTAGRRPIDTSLLDSFTMSPRRLAEALQELLGVEEPLQELVADRLWRLGGVRSANQSSTFFLARGLHWDDSTRLVEHAAVRRSAEPILLALSDAPEFEGDPRLLPLSRVLTVRDGRFTMDMIAAGIALAERDAAAPGLIFRREGSGWLVSYGGESVALRDSHGLGYIQVLLRLPFQEFDPEHLLALAATRSDGVKSVVIADDGLGRLEYQPVPVLDAKGRRDLATRIAELRDTGDVEEAAVLELHLRQATRPGGGAKTFETPAVTAARNVRRAIGRALDRLERQAPRCSLHLRGAIALGPGKPIAYRPEQAMRWETDGARHTTH